MAYGHFGLSSNLHIFLNDVSYRINFNLISTIFPKSEMRELVHAGKEISGYKKVQGGTISRQTFTARQIEGGEYDENEYVSMGYYNYPLRDDWLKESPESFVMPSNLSKVFLNEIDKGYKWPINV